MSPKVRELTSDAVREEIERILLSDLFRDSPTLKRLLRFLVEETLAGREDALKEYNIGTLVFQRGEFYDPKSESIVRVQASVLRKKLVAYYAAPGAQAAIRIDLPKGHYVPQFQPVIAEPEPVPAPPLPAIPVPRRWPVAAGIAALAVLVLAIPFWFNTQSKPAPQTEWRNHPLWVGFFEPNIPAKVILGAAMFYYVPGTGLIVRDNHIQMPDSQDTRERLGKLEARFGAKLNPAEIYTGVGDAVAAYTLGSFFQQAGHPLPIELSRHSRWPDLVTNNLIIVASLRFYSMRQELPFPTEFQLSSESAKITLLHPRPGEPADYASVFTGHETGTDYALISVWPGTVPDRRVMTVGGLFTWGTAGAAHFATNPGNLRALAPKLQSDVGKVDTSKGLQVLLRVQVKDGQPIGEEYVTHRWLR